MPRSYATSGQSSSSPTNPDFVYNETPSGTIDGSNATFTLASIPAPASSLELYMNGQFQTQGFDYTLSSLTITFSSPPSSLFSSLPFKAFYQKAGSAATYAYNETPTGSIDGSNAVFTLANSPSPTSSLQLYLNGQFQTQGYDYTLSGSTITFSSPPSALFASLPFVAFYVF